GQITDIDGNIYTDFRLAYGPIILGYRDQRVDEAVVDVISNTGSMFGLSLENEAVLAHKIKDMCPHVELLRFANSGT
ncbi:aminotransferase class III-fold pyridoxal phosphate-dependent enzyme, partial [Aeromonas veronii]|uniref:aminotransferase class III-fold pyridoxal phosphate-dependent enzyme n=2 Tax=Pseudomonadota TaxID=1224 RepID=UPI00406CB444